MTKTDRDLLFRLRPVVRFLSRYPLLRVVAHAVRRASLRDRWELINDFDGDLKFHCNLGEHIGSQMFWRDSYSWDQLQLLRQHLKSDSVFLDVGANQGEFTIFVAKHAPKGSVCALEPSEEMFERLARNVRANDLENVRLIQKGLWSTQGSLPLFTSDDPFDDGSSHEGLGTLFRTPERPSEQESVALTTLDELTRAEGLNRIDVIKIDVEGAEDHVIRGGLDTLNQFRPVLLMEVSQVCLTAAGTNKARLLEFLSPLYDFELVQRAGRSRPVSIDEIGDYQNVLCLPKSNSVDLSLKLA